MGESHRAVLDKPITCGESPPHTHTLLKRNDSGCASLRQVAVTGISGGKGGVYDFTATALGGCRGQEIRSGPGRTRSAIVPQNVEVT